MPSLSDVMGQDLSAYEPVDSKNTAPSGPPERNLGPGLNPVLRCPLPPIWSESSDASRQFYQGGAIPQYRLLSPNLNPPTGVTNVTNTTYTTTSTVIRAVGGGGSSSVSAPVATTSSLGIVQPDGATITISSGVITSVGPTGAGNQFLGTPADGSAGVAVLRALVPLDLPIATTSALGAVIPDGTSIIITSGGVISSTGSGGGYSGPAHQVLATPTGASGTATLRALVPADLPTATVSALGVVRPDGTTITISSGVLTSVGGSGTVTSVALTVPSRQTVTGSPITTSGTFVITDNTQSANTVFAGPSTGSAAVPTFRSIVPADLPVATTSALGVVKPDGTTITIVGGTISASSATLPLTVCAVVPNGSVGTNVALQGSAPRAGSVSSCVVTVTKSDPSTALTFSILKNGTNVFSTNPTVAAGASAGSTFTFTTLTSVPLAVAKGDVFSVNVTSGTVNWQFQAQLE